MPDSIRITAIQRLCVHDGTGIRTTVFLQGCYLDCPWCCNPETKMGAPRYFRSSERCVRNRGNDSVLCRECSGKTFNPTCPWQVFRPTVEQATPQQLYEKLIADYSFWRNNGGVTFSGGEPLMQAKALVPLLEMLKRNRIHITFETSVYAPETHLQAVLPLVDHFIVDVKRIGRPSVHSAFVCEPLHFEKNMAVIATAGKIHKLRTVLIRNVTDTIENIERLASLIDRYGLKNIELLQYHSLGNIKYEQLGLTVPTFNSLSPEESERVAEILKKSLRSSQVHIRNIRL